MKYVEKIIQVANERADYKILADENNTEGISFRSFLKVSGKVYAYLKSKGIGKEDVVMIFLPRGINHIMAAFGVMRNGSVFLTVEDTYEPKRVEFMKKDCNCKLVIDSKVWEEIQGVESIYGFEETDEHDAAMIIYTSGSTGNPKGVLHEYGNFDRMLESLEIKDGEPLAVPEDKFALTAPLNFIAAQLIITYGLSHGIFMYVVPYDIIKNPMKIVMFFMMNGITGTFLTPSHIRKMKVSLPGLKFCIIGSEPANNIYLEGFKIHNCYLMSESGFLVSHFVIDKKYDFTPVGKCEFDHEIMLLDENGQPVKDGEEGEICFDNRYVRGYINLPEETQKNFVNGIYHTGDLAYRNEDGQLVIAGRLSDMVKVNGNRVEPGEIEETAKRVFNIDFAACRIFQDERSTTICLYYTDKNFDMPAEEARAALSKYLPPYMVPNFFIHIDSVPLKATGKMDRKALPKPDLDDCMAEYEAPTNEIEEKLCQAFEKALDMQKIGINDDFYSLGGDSIAAMELLSSSGINGLNASDIFAGKTPKKIAELWLESHPDGVCVSNDELDDLAKEKEHPLTPYQSYMFNYQLYTPMSTMNNLNTMLKINIEGTDLDKFEKSVNMAIANHPALMTKFIYNDNNELVQKYEPEYLPNIKIEEIDPFDFKLIKNDLIKPFKLVDSRLYRCYILKVRNDLYLFFDVHHTVFDGTSFQVLLKDIVQAYYDMPLERDYYYAMLEQMEKAAKTPRYKAAKEYFHKTYDGEHFSRRPEFDHKSRENKLGSFSISMDNNEEGLAVIEEQFGINRNAFFNVVALVSLAMYNAKPDVQITWTYNGRDDIMKSNIIGLLLKDLPIKAEFKKKTKITELFKDIQKQVADAIANSSYPYTTVSKRVVEDDSLCFLYQRNIRDAGGETLETVDINQSSTASENVIDVQVIDDSTGLGLSIDYSASIYDEKSIKRFAKIFMSTFESLLNLVDYPNATVIDLVKDVRFRTKEWEWLVLWMDAK